ncbi:MAG: hypothetical protein GX272_07230 [Epulopiscium sp.]|nr:hypothetical protein [Candidatus Epulonipiscium sp.]
MISAIEKCHAVIVIFSSNSSQQVLRDVGKAKEKDKPIVTLKIEDDSLSKHLEYYLSSPYTLDISKISLNEAIDQLEKLLKNIVLPSEFNPSNLTDSTLSKISKSESIIPGITMPEQSISKPTISEPTTSEPAIPSNQVYSTNTAPSSSPAYTDEYTKTARKFFKWLPRGFRLFMLALIWLAHINTSTDDIDFTNTSTVNYTQSYSTAIKNVVDKNGIHFSYFKEDMLNSSRFTEEEIIEFAKTTVIELEQSEVRSFKKAAIMGKNEKPHGIEYLVKLDYICDRDYEKEGINQGEVTLYTNAIIIETKEGELKYLAVKEISEEDLNQKNEKIEKEALESVKEIVKQNNSKVAAVLVDTAEGTSQGSGFFIADGFIVTNYHVIKGGTNAIVRLSDTSTLAVEGIVCADAHLDLAVLKLKEQIGIEPVTLGGINEFEKDEWAVAINSPSGLFNDVSSCIISNTWTNKGIHLLQISIPMTYGNSGVALFNKNGKVVGVTSSYKSFGTVKL